MLTPQNCLLLVQYFHFVLPHTFSISSKDIKHLLNTSHLLSWSKRHLFPQQRTASLFDILNEVSEEKSGKDKKKKKSFRKKLLGGAKWSRKSLRRSIKKLNGKDKEEGEFVSINEVLQSKGANVTSEQQSDQDKVESDLGRKASLESDDGEPIPEVREEEDEEDGGIVLDLSPKSPDPTENSPQSERERVVNSKTAVVEDSPTESKPDPTQQEEQPPGDKSESPVERKVVPGKSHDGDDHSLKSESFEADFPKKEFDFPDTEFGESAWPSTVDVASTSENPDPFSAHKDPFSSQEGQLDTGFEAAFGSDPFTEGGAENSFADTVQFGETEDYQKTEGNDNNIDPEEDSFPNEEKSHDSIRPGTDPPGGTLNSGFDTSFSSDPFAVEVSIQGATEFVEGPDAEDSQAVEGIESDDSKHSSPADEQVHDSVEPENVSFR